MNDTRRFLRYVIPGLIFGTNLVLLLWLLRPDMVESKLMALKKDTGFAFIAGSVLASGGLGLIVSSIHHLLHWKFFSTVVDHRPHLEKLIRSDALCFADIPPTSGTSNDTKSTQYEYVNKLTYEESWIISTAIWNQVTIDLESEKVDLKSDSLCTLTHSLGTSRVAAILSGINAFVIAALNSQLSSDWHDIYRFVFAIMFSIFLVWIFHMCYLKTAKFARAFSDLALENYLHNRKSTFRAYVACLGSIYK